MSSVNRMSSWDFLMWIVWSVGCDDCCYGSDGNDCDYCDDVVIGGLVFRWSVCVRLYSDLVSNSSSYNSNSNVVILKYLNQVNIRHVR